MTRPFIFFLWFLSTTLCWSQGDYNVTVFGTDLVTAAQVMENYSNELDELLRLYDDDRNEYYRRRELLSAQLLDDEKFSYTNVYLFRSYRGKVSYIIDFVEKRDTRYRMDFREIATKSLTDPDSLVAKWNEYAELSASLYNEGKISDMSCPVIHCTWSFNHPELEPYLAYFNEFAPKNKGLLEELLNSSDSISYRAAAAFLLAHAEIENDQLLQLLMPSIKDPASAVRNNSMRVIYYIARAFPESDVDVSEIIDVLDYPSFTDRNKALVVLRSLPLNNLTEYDLQRMLPILLEIMEKKDAHNYKNAHTVLKKFSGKDYSADEVDKWREWAESFMDE